MTNAKSDSGQPPPAPPPVTSYFSWGRNCRAVHRGVFRPSWADELERFDHADAPVLAYGLGRSYGDSCLNDGGYLIDTAAMDLKESRSEKKKARRDYTLVWEARAGDPRNLDEAHYRVEIAVSGDRVSSWRSFWKLPETYTRRREQRNFISIAVTVISIVVVLAGVVWGLWMLVANIRRGLVRWGVALRLAAAATILMAAGTLLRIPLAYQSYPTAIPLATFQASVFIGVAVTLVGGFLMMGAIVGLLTSSFPDSLDAFRAVERRWNAVDAVMAALAAAGLAMLVNRLSALLNARFHAEALPAIGAPGLIATAAPALAALAGAATSLLALAGSLAVLVLILRKLPRRWMQAPLVLLVLLAAAPQQVRTPGELALEYGVLLAGCAAALAFFFWFGRRNYLAYALVFWLVSLRGPLAELFGNDLPGAHAQGWIVAAVMALSVIWVVLPAVKSGPAD